MPTIKKTTAKRRVSKGVVGRIKPISFEDMGIQINIYGRSGTGKTTLWSTFPKPILVAICSGSQRSGELRSIAVEDRKQINSVILKNSEEFGELIKYQTESTAYKTAVLDHVSGLQDLVLAELLGIDELPEQKSWGMASREQYGQCALQLKTYLRTLLDLTCNVVIVGQQRDFGTGDDSDEITMPYVASAVTPSVVGWLNPACDYICQTFIREQTVSKQVKIAGKPKTVTERTGRMEYCLRTGPHATYTTKFRVPKGSPLPEVIVDPDYNKIMQVIQGKYNAGTVKKKK